MAYPENIKRKAFVMSQAGTYSAEQISRKTGIKLGSLPGIIAKERVKAEALRPLSDGITMPPKLVDVLSDSNVGPSELRTALVVKAVRFFDSQCSLQGPELAAACLIDRCKAIETICPGN